MIPMGRPLLPLAEALLPYLKRIDRTRWYTNAGPLVKEYEEKIGKLFNCHAVAVSSGTSGLTAALMALGVTGEVVLPGWTFVATANAVRAAGASLYFIDVDETAWSVKPEPKRLGVSVFGAPVEDGFMAVDAAGAFDVYSSGRCKVGAAPVVISTHATKVFATGEGGLVLSTDAKYIHHVKELINHGLTLDREAPRAGINGKMSEYHAAVGLASLDMWPATRWRWLEMRRKYIEAFGDLAHTTPLNTLSWAGSVFCVRLVGMRIDPVIEYLKNAGITARRVWGRGCHRYEAYKDTLRNALPVTEMLADEVLFLPFSIDTTDEELYYIAGSVKDALRQTEEKKPNMWGV